MPITELKRTVRVRAARIALVVALAFGSPPCFAVANPESDGSSTPIARGADDPPAETSAFAQLLERTSASGSLTAVWQGVNGESSSTGEHQSRGNYRGDLMLTFPGGKIAEAEGKVFTHLRFGQGSGVTLRPTFTSTPNTTAFAAASSSDDAYAILAEAWYQLSIPVAIGADASKSRVEITSGKIDPFVFFDQNAVADDETVRFMNNVFVHNPLLDSGGDEGADKYGFTPGVRLAYVSELGNEDSWSASVAALGSGGGANFSGSLGDPFFIAQLETTTHVVGGRVGTYRIYAWRNGRASSFDDVEEMHSGWGLSADQQIVESVVLFTRVGTELHGHVRFDRALTVGADVAGSSWARGDDAIGVALGFLRTSNDYRNATADRTLVGYAASGTERIAELYYRLRVLKYLDVTPDAQWIVRPGADSTARHVFVAGVRARIGF